ncbi:Ribosomal RNA small subunit methyltransferase [Actinidia chinensis var. chinensis]|uniref:Ribosomal RNA small subunit methyltransferase n=1 Tax=Actinidia chinensis var. chinensis TaxID=1590841 RepID=A0A2R6RU42_ACTCC|nr:Ribosomal RNA small subunit methyltransferase [Actinidia chinensis var. chinensis]
MVRPYALKGRKRKKREENYDKEDTEQIGEEETVDTTRKEETVNIPAEEKEAENLPELAGIPIQPYDQKSQSGAIFILEKASLEVAKVGKNYQLLNSDDHANFLKRNNKNPADYRPDIAHQAILAILDSPLNKAGRLRALYVKTEKGVLFEVKPHVRIPRTYKRFSGIILQLLQKLSITAVGKREKLLRVIKNPVTQYLPVSSLKIGFSFSSEKLVDIGDYIAAVSDDVNFVFVVGTMAHGKIDKDYVDEYLSISGYPLSAAGCISRICYGLEQKWRIL